MARAKTPTLLPLDTWAQILGVNPLYFNSGVSASGVFAGKNDQHPAWFQYDWQASAQYSRESLARDILQAERDIAGFLHYTVAPEWISGESHLYSSPYIKLNQGKLISGGKRSTTLVGTAAPVLSDPDGDGFNEIATITIATTLTNPCELHLYFAGYNGERQWEIRPLKSVSIAAGVATIVVDPWLLFKPELQETLPINGTPPTISADDSGSYVTSVEVRRVYTDPTLAAVQFVWNCPVCGTLNGCTSCQSAAQDGCLQILDPHTGLVAVYPASYDSSSGSWVKVDWISSRAPDRVILWYYSGLQESLAIEGAQCDGLSYDMAYLVAILVASRVEYFFGANNNVQAFVTKLQEDMAESSAEKSHFLPERLSNSPFGTKRGELQVFRSLSTLRKKVYEVASLS